MIKCDKCNSEIRNCPACGNQMNQDVHGTWYHWPQHSQAANGCIFNGTHLSDNQLDWLWGNLKELPKKIKVYHCGFCKHYSGNASSCGVKACALLNATMLERKILQVLAESMRCPCFEEKESEKKQK